MRTWIYLKKGFNDYDDIKAAALAAVLNKSATHYNVVHTNLVSIYLNRLENVDIGSPDESSGDSIISLDLPENVSFQTLCKKISKKLTITYSDDYAPYLGFVGQENEIDRLLARWDNIILFYYLNENNASLIKIEESIETLNKQGYKTICGGSNQEPFIKGTYDFRGLLKIDEIIKNNHRIKAIITSSPIIEEVGRILHLPTIIYNSRNYKKEMETIVKSYYSCTGRLRHTIA